jgi:hypothetical protein
VIYYVRSKEETQLQTEVAKLLVQCGNNNLNAIYANHIPLIIICNVL